MLNKEQAAYLLQRFMRGEASPTERARLSQLLRDEEPTADWIDLLEELWYAQEDAEVAYNEEEWRPVLEELRREVSRQSSVDSRQFGDDKVRGIWRRIAVAASIVAVLFAGWWVMKDKITDDGPQTTVVQTNDVQAPDKNRASIRLADGRVIYLDSSDNGELATQQGVKVIKAEDGIVEYSGQSSVVSRQLEYNTLYNPRGSQVISMTLSDGSKVWLNAGSAITYPVAFIGEERKVEIQGEGYFEVAHNAKMPFIVTNGDVQVKVLGTHFNVNAYEDESEIKITLLEGSVKVESGAGSRESVVIKPGEQARTTSNGQLAISKNVDIEQVMAWKNGRFIFDGTDVQTTMRQLARWYDVEIAYEGKVNGYFKGAIDRNKNVSEVLKMLGMTDEVHFRIEGRRIVVMP